MEKKEGYRHILPHYQQPGQAYFVTFCLWNAVAHNALSSYTRQLHELRLQIEYRKRHHLPNALLTALEDESHYTRRQYIHAYDQLMAQNTDRTIDLTRGEIQEIIIEGLNFWAGTLLDNEAWCIMPNHVHWVFTTRGKDQEGKPVYLSTIMESVKKHTARKINKLLGREGHLWQKESFDTTIRDHRHLYRAMEYTLNNPVAAHFVKDRNEWPGSWGNRDL